MTASAKMRLRIDQLARQLGEVDDSDGDRWLDAFEHRDVEVGDAISAALIARQAAQQPPVAEEAACPQCGQTGRYAGDRQRE